MNYGPNTQFIIDQLFMSHILRGRSFPVHLQKQNIYAPLLSIRDLLLAEAYDETPSLLVQGWGEEKSITLQHLVT